MVLYLDGSWKVFFIVIFPDILRATVAPPPHSAPTLAGTTTTGRVLADITGMHITSITLSFYYCFKHRFPLIFIHLSYLAKGSKCSIKQFLCKFFLLSCCQITFDIFHWKLKWPFSHIEGSKLQKYVPFEQTIYYVQVKLNH